MRDDRDLHWWRRVKSSGDVTMGCIFQFFSIIYYMGIVVLPDKDDYWNTNPIIPEHHIFDEMGTNRDRFIFIWRHIHFDQDDGTEDEGSEVENNESAERKKRHIHPHND